ACACVWLQARIQWWQGLSVASLHCLRSGRHGADFCRPSLEELKDKFDSDFKDSFTNEYIEDYSNNKFEELVTVILHYSSKNELSSFLNSQRQADATKKTG
ncbi:hypothetical protein, partial [Ottowia sp.]|uniref:hypothetical protein n=1 Tax=Ottowia sp. TaxID=1898956 RepID=UPI003A898D38